MGMTRDEMIDWLIDNDLNIFSSTKDFECYFASILRTGFIGYENQTNDELRQEILERNEDAFDDETPEESKILD